MLGFRTAYEICTGRSWKWPRVRDAWLKDHPTCVVTGQFADTVHHIEPVHVNPSRELDPTNFASMTDAAHFAVGHLGNWKLWNAEFRTCVKWLNSGRRGPVGEVE